jgi:NhaP-type Na+/H+ or K+/H+ antiporter
LSEAILRFEALAASLAPRDAVARAAGFGRGVFSRRMRAVLETLR